MLSGAKNEMSIAGARAADQLAAMVDDPDEPAEYLYLGHRFYDRGRVSEAAACFERAAILDPADAEAHNLLGRTRQTQGDMDGAVLSYTTALKLDSDYQDARRNLATLLLQRGRREDSLRLWREDLLDCPDTHKLLRKLLSDAMLGRDLTLAGEYSAIEAQLRWGGRYGPHQKDENRAAPPVHPPPTMVTIPKLLHDIEQFEYLQSLGVLGNEFTPVVQEYRRIAEELSTRGPDPRVPLDGEIARRIGDVYSRIVHIRDTPRVSDVFSGSWDPQAVENYFLKSDTGVVVIDDFLSRQALEEVRAFCLESTVWTGNKYAHGRIGSFIQEGFCCPLLLQIAEELRDGLPRVLGKRYPLRGAWGFKTPHELAADATNHADFAAVNVNFWITPDSANLDPESGGLIIYDVDAPLAWDFHTYNGRHEVILPFLRSKGSSKVNIPYRENRAIIFNSDLFHATAEVKFRRGYENRRINITMLYGERQNDVHHPNVSRMEERHEEKRPSHNAWRSAAFRRLLH
jgi:tetratricopeptide (TPR) repeat protein